MTNSNISNNQPGKANLFLGHGAYCVDNLNLNSSVTFAFRFIQTANLIAEFKTQIREDDYYHQLAVNALLHFNEFAIEQFGEGEEETIFLSKTLVVTDGDVKISHKWLGKTVKLFSDEYIRATLVGRPIEDIIDAVNFFRNYTKTVAPEIEVDTSLSN